MNKIGNFKDTDGNNLLGFNFASNIITKDGQSVDDALNKKVNKIDGKGLSTNDYTDDDKLKLQSSIAYYRMPWSLLRSAMLDSTLEKGALYEITDYVTLTKSGQEYNSAQIPFNIIVQATSTNTFSEDAKCIRKESDTYFANAKLEAWEIKYCINNDTNRFEWVDDTCKGVIYYMKDEWDNECSYDFKNIKFKRYPIISMANGSTDLVFDVDNQKMKYALKISDNNFSPIGAVIDENNASYYFTFNAILQDSETYDIYDASVVQNGIKNDEGADFIVQNNKINEAHTSLDNPDYSGQLLKLNDIVINNIVNSLVYTDWSYVCHSNTFGNQCYSNTFGDNCYSNTFGNECYYNTFGYFCFSNTFGNSCNENTFGNQCYYNTFGGNCDENTFGDTCYLNTFGDFCTSNTFSDFCFSNTFGNSCNENTFGNQCYYNTFGEEGSDNTFGNQCYSNTFGNQCYFNTFGNFCGGNTFGNDCQSNNFYHGVSGTIKKDYIRYIVLEDRVSRNNFYSTLTTNSSSFLQRIRIKGLENGTQTDVPITLSEVNTKYEWVVAKNSSGVIKQYCLEDKLPYKLENTFVSTWSASTAYIGYNYQAQINIPNLTENDTVSVTFAGVDAISGNYYPTIQIYDGYILVFSKVDATITIPTIEITKINL